MFKNKNDHSESKEAASKLKQSQSLWETLARIWRLGMTFISICALIICLALISMGGQLWSALIMLCIASLIAPQVSEHFYSKYGRRMAPRYRVFYIFILLICLSFVAVSESKARLTENLSVQYAARHEALRSAYKLDASLPEFEEAVEEGRKLLEVADNQFKADHEDARAKLAAEQAHRETLRQRELDEKTKAEFIEKRDDIIRQLQNMLKEDRFDDALSLYNLYKSIGDKELDKLGALAQTKLEKIEKEKQAKAAESVVDQQYLNPVRGYVTFLEQAEQDFKANKASNSDMDRIRKTLVLFHALAEQLHNARQNKAAMTPSQITYLKKIEARLSQLQAKTFPGLRQAFGKNAGEILWEHNAYVTVSGNGNKVIGLTATMFASNANIKTAQEKLAEIVTKLRFNQVRYRWYKGADEFTYYKLDTPPDGSLAMFKYGKFEGLK